MGISDPRAEYDDLLVRDSREVVDPEEFRQTARSEPVAVGWAVFAFVFDADDRVLLIEQPWADGWLAPGGVPQPGESLPAAVTREVREETGVPITPIRPHAVDDLTVVNERTEDTTGWTTVLFEAVADATEITPDPGLDDEEITAAAWFDGLPDEVFNPDLTEAVYERCRSETRSN